MRARSAALASAFFAAALGCGSAEDRFAEHLRRAVAYEQQGEREQAALEYTSALEFKDDAAAHERLGELLRRQGSPELAAQHFQRAHELDGSRVSAIVSEFFLVASSNRARADALLAKAASVAPDAAAVQRARSELALLDGRIEDAQHSAERAAEIAPEATESQLQLARVFQARIRQQQLQRQPPDESLLYRALAAFERADQLSGSNVSTRLERARLFATWPGHDAEARAAYDDAVSLAAQQRASDLQIIALHALDDFARSRGDRETRLRALREILKLEPSKLPVWRDLAALLAGNDAEVAALFDELLRVRAQDPEAHRLYTNHLLALGHEQRAVDHLKQVLEDLDEPLLADELIQLHLRRLQLPQAQKAYERLRKQHPDDPASLRAGARIALAEGRNDDAVEILAQLPDERRSSEDFRLLALAQEQRGDLAAAQEAIGQAAVRAGNFAESIARADARIRCTRRDHAGCLAGLRNLARRRLPLSDAEQLLSVEALAGTGQEEKALRLLEQLLSRPEPSPLAVLEFARRRGRAEPKRAEALLLAAEQKSAGDPLLLRALVQLWRSSGRSREAIEHLNRSIGAGASNAAVLLLRAELLAEQGELDRAETDALRAFEVAPGLSGAVDLLAEIYTRQNRLPQARESFEEAEAAGVLHPGGRLLLARLRDLSGDAAGARALLESLLAERPNMHSAMSELARLLADQGGESGRAEQLAVEAASARRSSRAAAHAAGYVYLRSGRFAEALVELERARALPEPLGRNAEAELHYHLGLTLGGLTRNADARVELEQALALDPRFHGAEAAKKKLAELAAAG